MPRTTRSAEPLLRSRISWATRRRARETSPELITTRTVWAPSGRSLGGLSDDGADSGRVTAPNLLPRLTGRVVKGCLSTVILPWVGTARGQGRSDECRLDLGESSQQPVDKGRRLIGGQGPCQGNSLGDRDGVGDRVAEDDLPGANPQDGPVNGRHTLDRPTLAVGCQQLVDLGPLGDHTPDDLDRVLVQRVLGRGSRYPLA